MSVPNALLSINLFKSSEVLKTFPRCGYRNMRGHLRGRGHNVQWDRIRDSMRRLCPEEILMRHYSLQQ